MFKIIKPFYYDIFSCTAGECKDNCCDMKWNISVDFDTYNKYQNLEGTFGEKLRESITQVPPHIIKKTYGKCPFITLHGLCEIHANLGVEFQSETCKNYPRFATMYNDIYDLSLAISCPAVARIILTTTVPIWFIEQQYEDNQCSNIIEPKVLELFMLGRKLSIETIQLRKFPLWQRVYWVFNSAIKLYKQYKQKDYNVEYLKKNFVIDINELNMNIEENTENVINNIDIMLLLLDCIKKFHGYSHIWDDILKEVMDIIIKSNFCEQYSILHEEFEKYCKENMFFYENYLVYYLNQNFMIGLIEERQSLKKEISWMIVALGVLKFCAEVIWFKDKNALTLDKQVKIVYSFARVFEHGLQLKEEIYECMCEINLTEPETLIKLIQ